MTTRRFFIPPADFRDEILLDTAQSHHLRKVLRLEAGDEISVFDGCGRECVFKIREFRKNAALLNFVRETDPAAPESNLELTLAVPILKKSNTELVLQKAVELGVTHFIPIVCSRSEVAEKRWRPERANRIANEAARQCGRATVPTISEPVDFKAFVEGFEGTGFLLYEHDGEALPEALETDTLLVVTGPEGGWEPEEIELAKAAGLKIVHFGGRILRAETAAITATALVQNKYGDLS